MPKYEPVITKLREGTEAFERADALFRRPPIDTEEPTFWEKLFAPFSPKVQAWNSRLVSERVTPPQVFRPPRIEQPPAEPSDFDKFMQMFPAEGTPPRPGKRPVEITGEQVQRLAGRELAEKPPVEMWPAYKETPTTRIPYEETKPGPGRGFALSPGEQFIGEWVMPAVALQTLPTATMAWKAMAPWMAEAGAKRLVATSGRVLIAPLYGAEKAIEIPLKYGSAEFAKLIAKARPLVRELAVSERGAAEIPGKLPKRAPKGKPVPAEIPGRKEPWQMTREEFGFGSETNWPLKVSFKGQVYGEGALKVWYKENFGKAPHFGTPESAQKWVDKTHKRFIKQALSEGKPVSAKVLKDYPDLIKVPVAPEVTKDVLRATLRTVDIVEEIAVKKTKLAGANPIEQSFLRGEIKDLQTALGGGKKTYQMPSERPKGYDRVRKIGGETYFIKKGVSQKRATELIEAGVALPKAPVALTEESVVAGVIKSYSPEIQTILQNYAKGAVGIAQNIQSVVNDLMKLGLTRQEAKAAQVAVMRAVEKYAMATKSAETLRAAGWIQNPKTLVWTHPDSSLVIDQAKLQAELGLAAKAPVTPEVTPIPKAEVGMPEVPTPLAKAIKPPVVEAPLVEKGVAGVTEAKPPSPSIPIPSPKPFPGVNISSVDELEKRIASQKFGGKAGKVVGLPVVKQIGKVIKPIAVSDEPGTVLAAMSGMIDDQITGGTILSMAKPVREMGKASKLFKLDAKGISLAKDIKQLRPLPNGETSRAMHDIIEFAPWYDLGHGKVGAARQRLVQTIRETSEQMGDMLRNEGILVDVAPGPGQIRAMKGEPGWSFLHRVVNEVKEEAADSLARNLNKTLTKEGIGFPQKTGESNYQYLARFAESLKVGGIKSTSEINQLLDDFANLADVKVKKTVLEAKRSWATVAEGMKGGVTYESNPIIELRKQIRASYDLVKKKRLGEAVQKLLQTTTPIEKASAELGVDYIKLADAKATSARLVSYIQRALRGESLPGGAISVIRRDLPELATKLDNAMAILPRQRINLIQKTMRAATEAAQFTGEGAKAIAKRAQVSADIRLAFQELGAKLNITRGDIVEVIQQTINDKIVASRAIRQAYADMSQQQKSNLTAILTEAKALFTKNSEALKQVDALASKFAERMGPLGTAEYGRIPGVPGLGGRVIVPQRGKLGQEIADEVRQHFGYLPKSASDKAIEAVGLLGGVMRMGRLGFDLSATLIQQALSLGYDIRNLIILRPTAVWGKATVGALRSAISRNVDHLEDFLIKNHDIVKDLIQRGGLIESAEFTEAAGPLRGLLAKIPNAKAQTVAEAIGKHILGRSDAVFTTGRVEAGVNLYKAGYKAYERAGKLNEWALLTNNMTGVLSTRAMGIGSSQRNIESALAFLSPRFTRANGAILADIIFNPGSYTAKEAGTSLAALIAAGTAIYLAFKAVQNEEATLNPFDPDFGNVRIGTRVYRLGGIISDVRRLLVTIDVSTYAVSKHRISLSGKQDKTSPLDKQTFRMFQTKTSPISGTGIDIVRMMTDPIGIQKDFEGRPLTWANILGNWIGPSWTDPILNQETEVVPGTIAEIFGLSTYIPRFEKGKKTKTPEETELEERMRKLKLR